MAQTVASPLLTNLNVNQVLDANYQTPMGFPIAMKTLAKSYQHYAHFSLALMGQMFQEFATVMHDLYDIDPAQLPANFFTQLVNEVNADVVWVKISILKYEHTFVNDAELEVRVGGHHQPIFQALDANNVNQQGRHLLFDFSQQEFTGLNAEDRQIEIIYRDTYWANEEPRDDFTIFYLPYRQIHPEGYQQWIDFDEDIRVLLSIDLSAQELNPNPNCSQFLMNTIFQMLTKRLAVYNAIPNQTTHIHRDDHEMRTLSYMRDRIDPLTREAFWEPPQDPDHFLGDSIKFIGLQVEIKLGEQTDGMFCACNEFCNLNAFFYYNPVYRFLLVRHTQLYNRNPTNLANLYEFVLAILLSTPNPTQTKRPVLRFLHSANDQWQKNWMLMMGDPNLKIYYANSTPNLAILVGLTYNFLRNRFRVADTYEITDQMPFSEHTLECIDYYYKSLRDLHYFQLNFPQFIDPNNRRLWDKEFELISSSGFYAFIQWSYLETIQRGLTGTDYLFTKDYETFEKSDKERILYQWQTSVFMKCTEHRGNPFNVRFRCQPFLYAMFKIWEFLTKFEPYIDRVYQTTALRLIQDFCHNLDNELVMTSHQQNFDLNAVQLDQQLTQELLQFRRQLFVFYKLKTYSFAYRLQDYMCRTVFNVSKRLNRNNDQVFSYCTIIWENQWIEDMLRTTQFPNQLFHSDGARIEDTIEDFYAVFWGNAGFEIHNTPDDAIDSLIENYVKVRFWQQNGGNNRHKLVVISQSLTESLELVLTDCEDIYRNYILDSSAFINQVYRNARGGGIDQDVDFLLEVPMYLELEEDLFMEVLSILVGWLVKASCFMVARQVAFFLNTVRNREDFTLVMAYRMCLLSKPGFVSLFRTKQTAYETLETLEQRYTAFDDQIDRISKTVNKTKIRIKQMYKEFFKKLSMDWFHEVYNFVLDIIPNSHLVLKWHLITGLSFVAALIDDFREPSMKVRKELQRIRAMNLNQSINEITFNLTWDRCLLFLTQADAIQRANPFAEQFWEQYCQYDFALFLHYIPPPQWIIQANQ